MARIKRTVIAFLRALLSAAPDALLSALNEMVPKFFVLFPENREFLYTNYLNEFTVALNTRYPINREMLARVYEKKTYCAVNKFVPKGGCCLDIGANVGAVTLMLAQATGRGGCVMAFEPGPSVFDRLTTNIGLNPGVKQAVELYNVGLSNKEGVLYWNEHENALGNANLVDAPTDKTISVKVSTIDSFCKERKPARLDFIKIDVESMEYEVVSGGLKTIESYKPVIYYESLKVFEEYRKLPVFKMIQDMLAPLGYSFYKLDDRYTLLPAPYPDYADNTIALPDGKKPV